MKLVYVKWKDIMSLSGWKHMNTVNEWMEEEDGGSIHESVGWLFAASEDEIVITPHNQCDGPNIGDPMKIPKAVVVEMRDVKSGRKMKV